MNLQLPDQPIVDDWQIFLWNQADDFLSRPQKLELMLIMEAAFNAFDPFRVVQDLLQHRNLWQGVVMERGFPMPMNGAPNHLFLHGDLIALRDVGEGLWNVDTLYILTSKDHESALQSIVQNWRADEIGFERGDRAGSLLGSWGSNSDASVLRVWWD